jgi:hypothetical protein
MHGEGTYFGGKDKQLKKGTWLDGVLQKQVN